MVGISLVVTCYNLERYIDETLCSVFSQDYSGPMEVIIIDDASQDRSPFVIEEAIRKYGTGWDVTFLRNERNLGISGTTDRAWKLAKYEWIVEVDGDDIQYRDRCSKTARLIELYPNAGAVIMAHQCVNSEGEKTMVRNVVKGNPEAVFYVESPQLKADIYMNRGIHPVSRGAYGCSFAISKKVVNLWGPLNDGPVKHFAQDPPWELRAFLSFPLLWSNEKACKYRSHSSNILNRERKSSTVKDYINNELDMCHYDKKELMALDCMLADIGRIYERRDYSDWSSEDIELCKKMLEQYHVARGIRADWWQYSFFGKLYLLLRFRKCMPVGFGACLVSRLIPLRVFVLLKLLKKRGLRGILGTASKKSRE